MERGCLAAMLANSAGLTMSCRLAAWPFAIVQSASGGGGDNDSNSDKGEQQRRDAI